MKKGYVLMMVMLFFAVLGFVGCSDDEGGLSDDARLLVGTWQSESNIKIFKKDGTGFSEALNYDHEYSFTWKLDGTMLSIIDDGEAERFTIESLDESTLELSFRWSDGEIDYYTYKRID